MGGYNPEEREMSTEVLFVVHGLGIGGAEKQLLEYIRRASKGMEIKFVYFRDQEDSPDLLKMYQQIGIRPVLIDRLKSRFPIFLLRLVLEIRKLRPAIVHAYLAGSSGNWGRLAAWLAGVPFIFHSDRSPAPPVSLIHRLVRPFLDRKTARFFVNADAIADWLSGMGVPRDKIIVIPNGVDLDRFMPDAVVSPRPQWGIRQDAVVAGFLGKFRPEKRLDLLLDAVLALPEQERPDYLVLGGDGPLMPMVRQRVESDPWLQKHCLLLGLVEDVSRFMAGIDYLVLNSDYEGMPNVVLEAMAMRRSVVATRVSDVPKIINGVGFLAEPGNVRSLAEALRTMQNIDPARRLAMGEVARARVLENWEIKRAAERFWNAHLEVLG